MVQYNNKLYVYSLFFFLFIHAALGVVSFTVQPMTGFMTAITIFAFISLLLKKNAAIIAISLWSLLLIVGAFFRLIGLAFYYFPVKLEGGSLLPLGITLFDGLFSLIVGGIYWKFLPKCLDYPESFNKYRRLFVPAKKKRLIILLIILGVVVLVPVLFMAAAYFHQASNVVLQG